VTKRSCRCDTKNKILGFHREIARGVWSAPAALVWQESWVAMTKRGGHGVRKRPADLLAGVDQDRPFPRFPLTDEQWEIIVKLSGIPKKAEEARHHIETTIGIFRQFQAGDLDQVSSAKIREELESLADAAQNLHDRLSKLAKVRDAYTALTGAPSLHSPYSPLDRLTDFAGPHQSEHLPSSVQSMMGLDGQRRLSQVLDVLLRLPKWLLVAKYRGVEAKKGGPQAGNVYWLVGNLDGIREQFTGKKITRSYKDDLSKKYITYVCRIADPDIGDGTIDKAMRSRIKRRDRIRRSVD